MGYQNDHGLISFEEEKKNAKLLSKHLKLFRLMTTGNNAIDIFIHVGLYNIMIQLLLRY